MNVKTTLLLLLLLFSVWGVASERTGKYVISDKLKQITGFDVQSVGEHESGLYEIVTDKGIFYSTPDGEHLINGSVHRFQEELYNLTKDKKAEVAKTTITKIKHGFVTYPSANEAHEIIVFFDTSCGYCRTMHNQMSVYNALGITVHYAIWPRQGVFMPGQKSVFTDGYRAMEDIVCSANPTMAMNMVMRDESIPSASCDNKIQESFSLGEWLGVSGTPAVFNMDGSMLSRGYLPPKRLLDVIVNKG